MTFGDLKPEPHSAVMRRVRRECERIREYNMSMSPTQRTIRALKDQGRVCGIVERFLANAGPFGQRKDLFGIIDIIALDPKRGVMGIQSCGQAFSEHWKKLTIEKNQESHDWLSTPGASLWIYGWRKVKLKRGGKAMRWAPRIKEITLEDLG